MRRFHFTLDSVLRLRAQQAEAQEAALARLLAELRALDAARLAFEQERAQADVELTAGRELDSAKLAHYDAYRRWANAEYHRHEARIRECQTRVTAQRLRALESRRLHELLLKLKSQALAAWTAEAAREEQTLADEVYSSQWSRRR